MVTGVISSQARVVAMVMPSNGADQQRTVVNGYLATTNQYYYTCIFDFSYMYPTNPSLDQVPESGLLGLLIGADFSQTDAVLVQPTASKH